MKSANMSYIIVTVTSDEQDMQVQINSPSVSLGLPQDAEQLPNVQASVCAILDKHLPGAKRKQSRMKHYKFKKELTSLTKPFAHNTDTDLEGVVKRHYLLLHPRLLVLQ